MADGYVQLPADGVGKKTDTQLINNGVDDVHRQVAAIGSPTTHDNIAEVNSAKELSVADTTLRALSEEIKSLNDALLYFMAALLDKLPAVDNLDRARTTIESGTLTTVSTVSTVTTCSTVTNVASMNNFAGGNTTLIPYNLGAGAFHIYSNIQVTS